MALPGKALYTGLFRHTLDDKGRLTVPSAWRYLHAESDTFLALPVSGYIAVLPPAEVEKVYAQIAAMKLKDSGAQALAAKFFSETQSLSFDKAGRVILDTGLLDRAGIQRDAVLVGSLTKFNIYSPARWEQEHAAAAAQDAGGLLHRLDI